MGPLLHPRKVSETHYYTNDLQILFRYSALGLKVMCSIIKNIVWGEGGEGANKPRGVTFKPRDVATSELHHNMLVKRTKSSTLETLTKNEQSQGQGIP